MLLAQVKPKTLYGVHQRSPTLTWLVRIGPLPPGTEVEVGSPSVAVGRGRGRLCGDLCVVPGRRVGSVLHRRLALRYAGRVAGWSGSPGIVPNIDSSPSALRSPYNKGLHLAREAGRVPSRSACTSRPGGGMLLAQVKPKVVELNRYAVGGVTSR